MPQNTQYLKAAQKNIIVVGIGPGNPAYVLPAARQAIDAAKILVGGRRALADFARDGQETKIIDRDISGVMAFIAEKIKTETVVVLVSGDPGYYSLLDSLRAHFPPENIAVIAGISSVQYAFSRLALPWHEAEFISFHGRRPADEKLSYRKGRILGIITDNKHDSQSIPALLIENGWPPAAYLAICARLSYDDETIIETTLGAAGDFPRETHCVLVVQGK